MTAWTFRLNPSLDTRRLAAAYRASGRVHIPEFLVAEDAHRLRDWLVASADWRRVLNSGDKTFEVAAADWPTLPADRRAALDAAITASARHGFQFLYETIRVPNSGSERADLGRPVDDLAAFLSSPAVLEFFRIIAGAPTIAFADAQATAYGTGDFLTGHDDAIAGKDRIAAYVLGLTPGWRAEWGGLLMFHRADGHVDEAKTPGFNSLNLFAVPQLHSVSMVAPFADGRRYAVTGWLRSRRPE